jgi:hypothetical protein
MVRRALPAPAPAPGGRPLPVPASWPRRGSSAVICTPHRQDPGRSTGRSARTLGLDGRSRRTRASPWPQSGRRNGPRLPYGPPSSRAGPDGPQCFHSSACTRHLEAAGVDTPASGRGADRPERGTPGHAGSTRHGLSPEKTFREGVRRAVRRGWAGGPYGSGDGSYGPPRQAHTAAVPVPGHPSGASHRNRRAGRGTADDAGVREVGPYGPTVPRHVRSAVG